MNDPDSERREGSSAGPGETSPSGRRDRGPSWGRAGRPPREPRWHRPPDWGGAWRPDHWPPPQWQAKRKQLFFRFARAVGFFGLLIAALLGTGGYLILTQPEGLGQAAGLIALLGCSVSLVVPLLALGAAFWAFRRLGEPLANVMAAADAVAGGDLSVRVPEAGPGEFRQLARSFNRMTEELDRAGEQRRNLTADVAHELRTPLHILQGDLEGLLDGIYEPTPERLEAVLDETRLLGRLVDDLQTLSLAEAGRLALHPAPLDPGDLLRDVAATFAGLAEQGGVDLRLEIAAGLPQVTGDAQRLDQAFSNLVANALRHTPAGGAVTLSAAPGPEGGVRLEVADTGEGIPPADLPYVFERFWRGDRARTRAPGSGSGLGLAITRQLVQAHGGQIAVTSEPGQGAVFTVTLPVGGQPDADPNES